MEGDNECCSGREIAQINAIVVSIAAAVLTVFNSQLIASFGVDLEIFPVLIAAFTVNKSAGAKLYRARIVISFGRYLVFKRKMRVLRKCQSKCTCDV